jgi:AcrR family transcriptional regulator
MEMNKRPSRLGRPPKQEGRNTRERILDAAIKLFAAEGFAGTSLRQIAQAVGIKESAIYAHFESKEALYRTIFECMGPPVVIVDDLLGTDCSAIEQLDPEALLRKVARCVIEHWDEPRARLFICLALRESASQTTLEDALLPPTIEQVLKRLASVMQQWIEQGLIRGDFSAEHLAWELLAPLATIRVSCWHAQATEEERALGHHRANLHIEYFLRTVLIHETDNLQEKEQ